MSRIASRTLALLTATLVATAPLFADAATVRAQFACEGNDPLSDGRLVFSALASKVLTANGHGLRNELKRHPAERRAMVQTAETLSGRISYELSPGAKTIVVQYHEGGLGTLLKLIVGDVRDARLENGIASDGVFDVYARIADTDGKERLHPFLAITGNGGFDFSMKNDRGLITLTIDGRTVVQKTPDAAGTYLKFGDYLQAQDPATGAQEPRESIPSFYARHGIVVDRVIFDRVTYSRQDDGAEKSK